MSAHDYAVIRDIADALRDMAGELAGIGGGNALLEWVAEALRILAGQMDKQASAGLQGGTVQS